MVYKETQLKDIIKRLVVCLNKTITVEQVILFGSYAYGTSNKGSDLDIAVVSKKFAGMNDVKRIILLTEAIRHIGVPVLVDVDVLGFTPRELNEGDYFDITGEIKERGRVVYHN